MNTVYHCPFKKSVKPFAKFVERHSGVISCYDGHTYEYILKNDPDKVHASGSVHWRISFTNLCEWNICRIRLPQPFPVLVIKIIFPAIQIHYNNPRRKRRGIVFDYFGTKYNFRLPKLFLSTQQNTQLPWWKDFKCQKFVPIDVQFENSHTQNPT